MNSQVEMEILETIREFGFHPNTQIPFWLGSKDLRIQGLLEALARYEYVDVIKFLHWNMVEAPLRSKNHGPFNKVGIDELDKQYNMAISYFKSILYVNNIIPLNPKGPSL